MPSFWSWLCFPKKGYRTRSGEYRRPRTHTDMGDEVGFDFPHSSTKRKLKGNQQIHADHIRVQNQFSTQEPEVTAHPVDSEQRLVDDYMTNKRRRLQDIFNMNEKEKHFLDIENAPHMQKKGNSKFSNEIRHNNFLNNRNHSNFGSEYTPKGFQNQRVDNYHVVSMYRYVPKAVQNVYASKALEGGKVDDYFAHLHRQNSMTSFANAKMVHNNTDKIPPLTFRDDSNNFSVTTADKIFLIEKDENENEESSDNLQQHTDLITATRTDSVLEASFDSMWNSNGEVLY